MARSFRAAAALAALCAFAPSVFAADGAANRNQVITAIGSASSAAKALWDARASEVAAAVSALSSGWDSAASTGGWSADDAAALAAFSASAGDFSAFKSRLLADSADLKSKISSQRDSAAVSLETLSDEVSLSYSALTDAQRDAYLAKAAAVSAESSSASASVVSEIARMKARYADLLSSSLSSFRSAFQSQSGSVAASKASYQAYVQIRDLYPKLSSALAAVPAASAEKIRAAFVSLSGIREQILSLIRSNLSAGVDAAVKSSARLASARTELDSFVAARVAAVSAKLSSRYSDADTRFYALTKATNLLASQSGTLSKAFGSDGNFRWSDFATASALASAVALRDEVSSAVSTLAGIGSGSLDLPSDATAVLSEFYLPELSSAKSALNAYAGDLSAKLEADSRRVMRLVDIRVSELNSDLSSLKDYVLRRARIAKFAKDAASDAEGNAEWVSTIADKVAALVAAQDEAEFAEIASRVSVTKVQAVINAALRAAVSNAVAAGQGEAVVAKFKEVKAKVPALMSLKLKDADRYALHYLVRQIDAFVKKIEG